MLPAAALLQMLGSGVGLVNRLASSGKTPVEGASFAELLDRVSSGTLRSAEPVNIDPSSGIELSRDQLARVTEAATRLESAGAARGVILIDGRALTYDVLTRTVTGEVDLGAGAATGIDAVVTAPQGEQAGPGLAPPNAGLLNTSLLDLLAKRGANNAA
ncbi:MAG: hypothetical protein H6810_10515 [Phycisphaeraceae bacterium]|nr:MAG: hypothetical protein H6810_10515 [Phycisphaeraceae bacterium]